jgi:hypothetical protein
VVAVLEASGKCRADAAAPHDHNMHGGDATTCLTWDGVD